MDKKDFLIVILFLALLLCVAALRFWNQPNREIVENENIRTESPFETTFVNKDNSNPIHKGYLCSKIEDFDCLISESSKAIKIDPEDALAFNNRAFGFLRLNNLEMAEIDISKALLLDPDHTLALNNRGLLYIKQKKFDLAMKDVLRAEKNDSTIPEIYLNKGLIFAGKSSYGKAIEEFNKAIELDPALAIAYEERGKVYKILKENAKANADILRAEEIRKNY
jgi:tetratricopeptide (TPR) repeat protein